MLAFHILRAGLLALGTAALGIGASMFLLGPEATGGFFASLLVAATGIDDPMDGLAGANVESELRFYAVFWFAYGWLVISSARALPEGLGRARALLGLFFLGGLGRVLSHFVIGAPHPLFIALMVVELVLPLLLIALSYGARAR